MSTCSIMPKCLICMLYVWLLERQLLKHIKKTLATFCMNVCFHQVVFFMFVLTLFIFVINVGFKSSQEFVLWCKIYTNYK